MSFNSFIPRGGLYKPHETSRLHSPREPGSPSHLWKHLEKTTQRTDSQTQVLAQLRAEVDILKRQRPALSGMHPFKVYNFPRNLRRFKNADDWRRVKVRGGYVRLDGASLGDTSEGGMYELYAYGSDGAFPNIVRGNEDIFATEPMIDLRFQVPPLTSANIVPGIVGFDLGGWNEAIVPDDGNDYWIWFSFVIPQDPSLDQHLYWGLCFGTEPGSLYAPVAATALSTGFQFNDNWRTFPARDPYHIPIARVVAFEGKLFIFQELNETPSNPNVYTARLDQTGISGPINESFSITPRMRGGYRSDNHYFVGDAVWIIEDSSSHSGVGLGFLSQYIYVPTSYNSDASGTYLPRNLLAPLNNILPTTHTPDPWVLLSRSPYQNVANNPDWRTGAYDATKDYLRSQ